MKKRGFTLVELLAVITVIAIIGLISVPVVEGIVKRSRQKAYDRQIVELVRAAKEFATENYKSLPFNDLSYKNICLSELQEKGYIESGIIYDPRSGKEMKSSIRVTYYEENKSYKYEVNDDSTCGFFNPEIEVDGGSKHVYHEEVIYEASPEMNGDLIPIAYSAGTIKKASLFSEWYNYSKKEWANAVLVKDNQKNNHQSSLPPTEIKE